jgi:hypothetical protein
MIGEAGHTGRGFELVKFRDIYGNDCSLQESSKCVCEDEDGKVADPLGYLWLGIDDPKPQIMKRDAVVLRIPIVDDGDGMNGWTPYPIPEGVSLSTRMHLNEHQVRALIARLQHWLDTGRLIGEKEMSKEAAGG